MNRLTFAATLGASVFFPQIPARDRAGWDVVFYEMMAAPDTLYEGSFTWINYTQCQYYARLQRMHNGVLQQKAMFTAPFPHGDVGQRRAQKRALIKRLRTRAREEGVTTVQQVVAGPQFPINPDFPQRIL